MANAEKRCSRCKMVLSINMFHADSTRRDGKRNNCKVCIKIQDSAYYATDKGRQVKLAYGKRYSRTPAGKTSMRKRARKRYVLGIRRHPAKLKAKQSIAYAVRTGRIAPATDKKCVTCRQAATDHHHYAGYAPKNRLKVLPMCRQCHVYIHRDISYFY